MATLSKRFWLTFSSKTLMESPVLWRMSRAYPDVVFDIRQASFNDDMGIMAVLLSGESGQIEAALDFLARQGVTVEPIEKNVIEG